MDWLPIEMSKVGAHLLRLGIAFVLTLPIAWDRERAAGNSLGLRTFPLVAMASCAFILIGQGLAEEEPGAVARIFQGLITGIGFLGGGAIIKDGNHVHGTATAASIWATAGIGAAIAFDRLEIAFTLALVTYLTLRHLKALKASVGADESLSSSEEGD